MVHGYVLTLEAATGTDEKLAAIAFFGEPENLRHQGHHIVQTRKRLHHHQLNLNPRLGQEQLLRQQYYQKRSRTRAHLCENHLQRPFEYARRYRRFHGSTRRRSRSDGRLAIEGSREPSSSAESSSSEDERYGDVTPEGLWVADNEEV
ncbi:hypothetical protein PC123_g27154 [Phytophthora cactorum]|nr:hypothetical protein PC120_g10426 [Phytophthora cactorum]KAG4037279.1 hypothetical protein PC123_g27154 [Phytophthora cactorum]